MNSAGSSQKKYKWPITTEKCALFFVIEELQIKTFEDQLGRWYIRSPQHFGSMNQKCQETQDRLYSEDRKRGNIKNLKKR
jgi:hypothetical protein